MASKMTQLLVQADLLPSLVSPLWDTSSVLPSDSAVGILMHALAGYEPRPAGMQVVSYALTVAVVLVGMWLVRRPAPVSN
jgi:high-affinity iron transporter